MFIDAHRFRRIEFFSLCVIYKSVRAKTQTITFTLHRIQNVGDAVLHAFDPRSSKGFRDLLVLVLREKWHRDVRLVRRWPNFGNLDYRREDKRPDLPAHVRDLHCRPADAIKEKTPMTASSGTFPEVAGNSAGISRELPPS
jgi:hypothetical protein